MRHRAEGRPTLVALIISASMMVAALPVLAAEPQPVLPWDGPVPPPPAYDPSEPYDPNQSGARCPAGSTRMSASGELILGQAAPSLRAAYPAPVVPVPWTAPPPPPGCLTDLSLTLIVKSPDDRRPDGADASVDAIAVPRSALEAGFDVSLPALDRSIDLSDPGPDWELVNTSCSCAGWTSLSATGGGHLASSLAQPGELATYPGPIVPVPEPPASAAPPSPGDPGSCSGSTGAPRAIGSLPPSNSMAPSYMHALGSQEITAYPGPMIGLDWYRQPAVVSWDASGMVSIDDPDGVGGTFSCVWTVEMKQGQLAVKTVTRPAGQERRFDFQVTPTGPQAEDASPVMLPGTPTAAQASLESGPWTLELRHLPREWELTASDCSETDGTTPSVAQGTAAVAGVDPGDRIDCTFKLRLRSPKPGRWSSTVGASRVVCDGFPFALPEVTDVGRIRVTEDGDHLIARGLDSDTSTTWHLYRDQHDLLRYTGSVRLPLPGARGTFRVAVKMVNEKRMVGSLNGTIKVRDATCVSKRSLKLSYAGGN